MPDMTEESVSCINSILKSAAAQGRTALFEHEVYGVLSAVGLTVPRFRFLRAAADADAGALRGFGHTVVVKIVSSAVSHKQRVGGVKKVATADPLYLQYVMQRMHQEVLSHYPSEDPPKIAGFLIVEYIPHTEALGYEVLIGFRHDAAFGPVLTVSKGGDDAEFFAAEFDPANLFLPPIAYEEALAFTQTMHIRHKFQQIGHPEYLTFMARALTELSSIALRYSPLAGNSPLQLKSLEVNPFAISKDNRVVALDGLAELSTSAESEAWSSRVNLSNLDAFFQPRGVAVIGVSGDPTKYSLARDVAELLHDLSRDDLFLVNPHGGTVRIGEREYPLYPDLGAVPVPVELAVYAAPALAAPDFLKATPPSVRAVILIPGVPSSVPYAQYTQELRQAIRPGVRVMGPNCMGVYQAPTEGRAGLNTLFINEQRLEVRSSPTANAVLLTQSGALAVTLIDKLRGCRPLRSVVSFGNKLDVKVGELLAHFQRDPAVKVIAVYLEGLDPGEGRVFFEQAQASATPIVAYKGGRTEAGARSAASHTAAMSGSYEVFNAACQQAGVVAADTIEDWYDYIRAFALLADRPPRGNRVAGVVNAGFESTVGADQLRGLTQARLGPTTIERLNAINRSGLVDTSSPFLDITPMADDALYAQFAEAVIQDDGVDCVFVAVVPHAVTLKTVPETCRDPDGLAQLLVNLSRRHSKPIVISVNAGRHYADFVWALEEGGLPVYPDIRCAISALDTFVSYQLRKSSKD